MKIIVDGIATEYRDEGQGAAIVFLHGWKHSLSVFDALVSELHTKYRIIRLDLPGFGGSEVPPDTWSVSDYAQHVDRFLQKIGVSPAALVGHSLGGRIIIKGIGTNVLKAQKIILISAAGLARRRTPRLVAFAIIAKVGNFLSAFSPRLQRALKRLLYRLAGSDLASAGPLQHIFRNIVNEDLAPDASRITVPALIVWGQDDRTTPVDEGERLTALIQGSRFECLQDAGHNVHMEKPRAVADLLSSFV